MGSFSTRRRRAAGTAWQRVATKGLTLALLVASSACVCQQEGCESFESLRVTLPLSANELDGARLEVCRNDACFAGELALAAIDWSDASRPEREVEVEPVDSTSGGDSEATCHLSPAGSGFSLLFEWHTGKQDEVARGDVLRISIEAAQGDRLFSRDAKVTAIDENYPNGEECDATPCRSATLKG